METASKENRIKIFFLTFLEDLVKASNAKINLLIGILQAQKQMNIELVDRLKDEIKTLFGILSRTQNQNSLKKKSN